MFKGKYLLFILAFIAAFSFSAVSEGASRNTDYKTLTIGELDEESDSTPESIHEAIELAGEIIDAEDEDIDYEKYKNLIIVVPRSYGTYSLEEDDRYVNDISGIENLESITLNGSNNSFVPSDEGERHFIFTGSGPDFNISNVIFTGNEGGGVYIESGKVSFDNAIFRNIDITASDNEDSGGMDGAAISVSGGEVYVTQSEFTGNTAANGGAISISGGSLEIYTENRATSFTNNTASSSGGAVNVTNGTLTISGASFSGGTAEENGGAINATGGTITISDATFSSNRAETNGGAIYSSGSTLNLNSGNTFTSNTAEDGGALYLSGTAAIASGNEFNSNEAASNGGALYIEDGRNVNIAGAITIEGNSASSGGAVYLPEDENARLNINGSDPVTFKGNYASSAGGAIYASRYSELSFRPEVNFESNYTTDGNGGALYIYTPEQLPATTLNFSNNRARRSSESSSETEGNGGAIYISGQEISTLTLDSSKNYNFTGNTADNSGGAIYTVSSDVVIENTEFSTANTAINGAGGLVRSGGSVTIEEATISNQQGALGGAIYGSIVNVNNSTLTYNHSTSSGGAIYASEAASITKSTFTSNGSTTSLSTNYGGAIYAIGALEISESEFTNNASSAQNSAQGGGAIYVSGDSIIENSTFASNAHRNNNNNSNGGGAIFARGRMVLSGDIFRGNSASGNDNWGGGVFGNSLALTASNVLFEGNEAQGNGGGICIYSNSSLNLTNSTFSRNQSRGAYGGAIYAQGPVIIESSYFNGNVSARDGGGVYYSQTGNNGTFSINSSMLTGNTASGGQGGGLFIYADVAAISNSTFDGNNSSFIGDKSLGGAVYLHVEDTGTISNSTFTNNGAEAGSENYGGALASYGKITVIMSTFTDNRATDGGGAIYIQEGPFTLTATIAVGNNTTSGIGNDIFSDTSSVVSGGYNRIGTFGQGGGSTKQNTSWGSAVGGNTDTDRQNSNFRRADFFGSQTLSANDIRGYIGSYLDEATIQLLTLMLSEDEHLALNDRATNIIPYTRRYNFPQFDQRGVDRYASGNALSIGAVTFDGDVTNPEPGSEEGAFEIQSVMMSGIPNTLRSLGQTASLTALIRYRNGFTAYGVPYDTENVKTATRTTPGEERVRWSSSSNNIVKIDKSGNITALATTPNNSAVMIMVSTVRNAGNSTEPATDSRPVRVTGQYSNMNISTEWQNYFMNYIQEITEEDISLMLVDSNTSTVRASSFQRNFKSVWDVASATQITDLTSSTPLFQTERSYRASDGKVNAKPAGVNINFQNRQAGDLFPLTYTWNFSGEDVKKLTGSDFSDTSSLNATAAEKLFEALRVDFVGSSKTWQVVGGSGVSAKDAYSHGALALTKADGNRGVRIDLTAYLANVQTAGTEDGPQLVRGSGSTRLLVIPDGSDDGAISGTMWMVQNASSSNNSGSGSGSGNGNGNSGDNSSGDGGSGGGGGCNSLSLGLAALALAFMLKRK